MFEPRSTLRTTRSGVGARLLPWLVVAALAGCQRGGGAELLEVDAVLPAEAQFGDSIQIFGEGFGLGSPATVTFRGQVYRAGRPPEALEVSFRAQTESQRELALLLSREAESAFCGAPEQASHATFRGDVSVAIAARDPGAPPATGTLQGAVLELYPAVKTQGQKDRLGALGREALEFLGIEVVAASEGGLEIVSVAPGSRASRADLRLGDRLVRAGGSSVLTPSDLVPEPALELELGVARGALERTLRIDVDGFSPVPPAAVSQAALPVLCAALWFMLAASPLARWVAWLAQNWLEQERARRRAFGRATAGGRGLDGPRWLDLAGGASGALVGIGVGAALLSPLLRRALVDVSAGMLATMFGAAALLGASAFVGAGAPGAWSMCRATRAACQQWLTTAPAWVAALGSCLASGRDLDELARAQGVMPWRWNAFTNPGLLLACVALLLTTLPLSGKPGWRLRHARPPRISWRPDGDAWFDRLYVCSTCGVVSSVFLGGGAQLAAAAGGALLPALGAAALALGTYAALVLSVSFVRGLCLGVGAEQWGRLTLRVCLPLSGAGVGATYLFGVFAVASPLGAWVGGGFGPASSVAVVLGLVLVAQRSWVAARDPSPPALSPWL